MNDAKPTAPKPSEQRGLRCPACGCAHLPVLYTRQRPGHVLRIRACRHCGRRVTTRERLQ